MSKTIERLIESLASPEQKDREAAERALIAQGAAARDGLLGLMSRGNPSQRRSAVRVLGRLASDKAVEAALVTALCDEDPKVRKNAAGALGRAGLAGPALLAALEAEELGWVRGALALALGAVDHTEAIPALQARAEVAEEDAEIDGLRKALDRLQVRARVVSWRRDVPWAEGVHVEVPVGLEEVALDEIQGLGLPAPRQVAPGVLGWDSGVDPWAVLPAMRCAYGLSLPVQGNGPRIDPCAKDATDGLVGWLAGHEGLARVRAALAVQGPVVPYRFHLETHDKVSRRQLASLIDATREALAPAGWVDSPSSYDVELVVDVRGRRARLRLRPAFYEDLRFTYRVRDVGASIHPAVGAALARLAMTSPEATVLDPTCGSATLLIERARLSDADLIAGDVSPTAIEAARANLTAADLLDARVRKIDAAEPGAWTACDEVLANLPFGLRTQRRDANLPKLYQAMVNHLAQHLRPGGRAVLYTTAGGALESALSRQRKRLEISKRLKVWAGGLEVGVWIITPRASA